MGANSSFTEIAAITYRHFKEKYLEDNVSHHTALHQRLAEKDRVDLIWAAGKSKFLWTTQRTEPTNATAATIR